MLRQLKVPFFIFLHLTSDFVFPKRYIRDVAKRSSYIGYVTDVLSHVVVHAEGYVHILVTEYGSSHNSFCALSIETGLTGSHAAQFPPLIRKAVVFPCYASAKSLEVSRPASGSRWQAG